MTLDDAVFGELDYEFGWVRYTTIEFCGKEAEIALMVDGEKEGGFLEKQYAAYNALLENWGQLQQSILHPILEYYKEKRHELGYDIELNEDYPLIETTEQLLDRINIVGISIPYLKRLEGRYIGLSFDCTWDEENGLGLRLVDETVIEVGYQDVAI